MALTPCGKRMICRSELRSGISIMNSTQQLETEAVTQGILVPDQISGVGINFSFTVFCPTEKRQKRKPDSSLKAAFYPGLYLLPAINLFF
jgi:hypothetical protein